MKTAVLVGVSLLALAAAALAPAQATSRVVATAPNAKLGKTILVTTTGLTLYSLSTERHGRFICRTRACLAFWKPLHVARGMRPGGIGGVGAVRRAGRPIQGAPPRAPPLPVSPPPERGARRGHGLP